MSVTQKALLLIGAEHKRQKYDTRVQEGRNWNFSQLIGADEQGGIARLQDQVVAAGTKQSSMSVSADSSLCVVSLLSVFPVRV